MNRLNLKDVSKYEIICELRPYIEVNDINRLINFLSKEKNIIDGDEEFKVDIDYSKLRPGQIYNFVLGDYNINLKMTTIAILAFLLDLKVTNGFATFIASQFGKIGMSVTKLDTIDKCIILEAKKSGQKYFDTDIINIIGNECINNHLNCNMRKESICCITKKILNDKFNEYLKKNVLEKKGQLYKLAF